MVGEKKPEPGCEGSSWEKRWSPLRKSIENQRCDVECLFMLNAFLLPLINTDAYLAYSQAA